MISIIVPSNREYNLLPGLLDNLEKQKTIHEIIVVDSGSISHIKSASRNVRFFTAEKGRAVQMNFGARKAKGDILLFLHMDTILPEGALASVEESVREGYIGGCFYKRFDNPSIFLKINKAYSNFRARAFKSFLGDNAIFIQRDVFHQLEGFPSIELMEDVVFCKKMRNAGKLKIIRKPVITSARRFLKKGIVRTLFRMQLIRMRYFFGTPEKKLREIYEK